LATGDVRARKDADRWATRLLVILGAAGGGFVGLLYAPDLQGYLGPLGIEPYTLGPGMVIITIAACMGALIAWRTCPWR